MMTSIVAVMIGIIFGALGRHHQGGASHRWIGMLLHIPVLVPATIVLGPKWWIGSLQAVMMIVGWYTWILMKERFTHLWHATWRYGGPVVYACSVTQFWWGLIAAPLAWLAVKWAKEDHPGIADEHRILEFILGGLYGAVWTSAVVFHPTFNTEAVLASVLKALPAMTLVR